MSPVGGNKIDQYLDLGGFDTGERGGNRDHERLKHDYSVCLFTPFSLGRIGAKFRAYAK